MSSKHVNYFRPLHEIDTPEPMSSRHSIQVSVKRLCEEAKLPTYTTEGSGAFDIYALMEKEVFPGTPRVFSTGLAFEIPEDHVMLIFSRSGHGFNENIRLSNCVGVIDSDYRGELMVKLTQDPTFSSRNTFLVREGDRIAQGMVLPTPRVIFRLVSELPSTERGSNGLGSTGS